MTHTAKTAALQYLSATIAAQNAAPLDHWDRDHGSSRRLRGRQAHLDALASRTREQDAELSAIRRERARRVGCAS